MMQNKCSDKDQTQNYLPKKNWGGAFCTLKGTDQKDFFLSWSDPKKSLFVRDLTSGVCLLTVKLLFTMHLLEEHS